MHRTRKLLFMTLAVIALGAGAAYASSISNGDFEKGNLSSWKAHNNGDGEWFVYKSSGRQLPKPVGGATLPKPFGKYAAALKQNGPGTSYLTQTVSVPASATTLSVELFWINDGGPPPGLNSAQAAAAGYWAFPGSWSTSGARIQYFALDLVEPSAKGFTTRKSDILGTIFKPKIRSTKARSGGWLTETVDVTKFQGKRIKFRLVEGDNSGYLNVGIDNLTFNVADQPTG